MVDISVEQHQYQRFLPNLLPQNFDKGLLKLANVGINKYLCENGLRIC